MASRLEAIATRCSRADRLVCVRGSRMSEAWAWGDALEEGKVHRQA